MLLQQKAFLGSVFLQVRVNSSRAFSFEFYICSPASLHRKKFMIEFTFLSFVCDGIDGWCARKFNQGIELCFGVFTAIIMRLTNLHLEFMDQLALYLLCGQQTVIDVKQMMAETINFLFSVVSVSTFGAVLDMITDR